VFEKLSLERVIKILERFGFSRADAKVYVYLAKTGPKKDMDLTIDLKMVKRQLTQILNHLKEKGVVTNSPDQPHLFSALDFEDLLKLYIRLNEQQAHGIEETKKELLENWKNMELPNNN
jgi:sugar-specific transcriptional regulator TrmB